MIDKTTEEYKAFIEEMRGYYDHCVGPSVLVILMANRLSITQREAVDIYETEIDERSYRYVGPKGE